MSDSSKPFQFKSNKWEFPNAKKGQVQIIINFLDLKNDFKDIEVLKNCLCDVFKLKKQ